MKIGLKTKVWESTDPNYLKEKMVSGYWMWAIMLIMSILFLMFNGIVVSMILQGLVIFNAVMRYMSYMKYTRGQYENKRTDKENSK